MMDRFLRNNTVVKILSAVLAILLWLIVQQSDETGTQSGLTAQPQQQLEKNVVVLYDEQNYYLVKAPKVTLTLRGSYLDIMNAVAQGDAIKAVADASKLGVGTHEVPVYVHGAPAGVSIESASVQIELEAVENREFPIELRMEGKPGEGMVAGDALVSPKTVIVTGAKSALNSIDQVVATISLDEAKEVIQTSVPLTAVNKKGDPVQGVRLSRDRVEVNIPIVKPSKSVPLRLQFKGDLAPGYAVQEVKQSGTVTIFGTANALAEIDSYPAPVIDLTGMNKTTKLTLKLAQVEGVTEVQPTEVQVEVVVVAAAKRTFDNIEVKVTGLKAGESYKVLGTTERVSVTVEGAKSKLDALTAQDINAFLDLTNQPGGEGEMRVQVNSPNFVKTLEVTPPTLKLEIQK
ncbi:YbbR domain-containing protein [Tumebacillus sp. BK434]|uniref:CdaR family protein n=1 Tax=Tumebacillus sp. BK434 TaxID=2512169 RepID=UPI00104B19DD|nr:CdaR family protein [Tumebacillus sp. BK434]TCP57865.1 YbbR domain-containing protein [Tumebacillus sp. BK434]